MKRRKTKTSTANIQNVPRKLQAFTLDAASQQPNKASNPKICPENEIKKKNTNTNKQNQNRIEKS